ncbi:hypothetical protein PCAR4_940006 [Paraburkholderia caribensis]|nr:hypothetical protein PCAR4_940006 [Paraburkholderia caribensis]
MAGRAKRPAWMLGTLAASKGVQLPGARDGSYDLERRDQLRSRPCAGATVSSDQVRKSRLQPARQALDRSHRLSADQ